MFNKKLKPFLLPMFAVMALTACNDSNPIIGKYETLWNGETLKLKVIHSNEKGIYTLSGRFACTALFGSGIRTSDKILSFKLKDGKLFDSDSEQIGTFNGKNEISFKDRRCTGTYKKVD